MVQQMDEMIGLGWISQRELKGLGTAGSRRSAAWESHKENWKGSPRFRAPTADVRRNLTKRIESNVYPFTSASPHYFRISQRELKEKRRCQPEHFVPGEMNLTKRIERDLDPNIFPLHFNHRISQRELKGAATPTLIGGTGISLNLTKRIERILDLFILLWALLEESHKENWKTRIALYVEEAGRRISQRELKVSTC